MDFCLSDLASMFSKGDCKDNNGSNKIFLWILVIVIICSCVGKDVIGGCGGNSCTQNDGNNRRGGVIGIVILLLLLCGGNNGILPMGNESGNTNTNIIKLDRELYEDEYI